MFDPVDALVSNFECYHRYFQTCVFRVTGVWRQLPILHRQTIARRGNRPATEAVADVEFMASLRRALSEEFGLARTGLHDPLVVDANLYSAIEQLDGIRLEDATQGKLDVLWSVIEHLKINEARAKLVVNTKTLAHVLTELVAPIDRTYTGTFLFRFAPEFDNPQDERALFYTAFSAFRWIAQRVDLARYVSDTDDWNTTRPKVIDNAIIGFVEHTRIELRSKSIAYDE